MHSNIKYTENFILIIYVIINIMNNTPFLIQQLTITILSLELVYITVLSKYIFAYSFHQEGRGSNNEQNKETD